MKHLIKLTFTLLALLSAGRAFSQTTAQPLILANRITQIIPAEGFPGSTITVRVSPHPLVVLNRQRGLISFGGRPIAVRPVTQTPRIPRIEFTRATGGFVNARDIRVLDAQHYSVTVPDTAGTGPMRLETISGSNSAFDTSVPTFTFVQSGYFVQNESQFDMVSIRVDQVEKLAPAVIQAVPSTAPEVFARGVAALPGMHFAQFIIGPNSRFPVMSISGNFEATRELTGLAFPLIPAGEFLTLRSEFDNVSGPAFTSLWYNTVFNLDGTIFEIYAYSFSYDDNTGKTTFTLSNQSGELASGELQEPASWPANPSSINVPMIGSDGTLVDTLVYEIANARFHSTGLNLVFTRYFAP